MLDYENNKEALPAAFSTALSQNIDALARFAALPYEDRQKLLFACSPAQRKTLENSMKILNR